MTDHSPDKQADDLAKVLEISRAMVATEDLDSLLKLIIARSMELLHAERATLLLYDSAADELVSRIAAGLDELRVPAGAGICGATIASRRTINVPDAYADARFNPDVDRRTGFRTRNILSAPLFAYDGSLVGVLQVLNKRRGAFDDHDVLLAETLGAQAGVAIQRARLIEHFLAKQQMERAMRIARDIQRDLLPKESPRGAGFDVAGFNRPADETGGDIYDFVPRADGRWMLSVADATGHGIGPALIIAETRAILRAVGRGEPDPAAVLGAANDMLSADLDNGRFVTCFLGTLDLRAASLRYASAGHGPLLFYTRRDDRFEQTPASGPPLGIVEGTDFGPATRFDFQPGDFAVITTDGFFEASNARDEQFGMERMTDVLRKARDLPAAEMIEVLHAAVCEFAAGEPQADDLTAVVIRRD